MITTLVIFLALTAALCLGAVWWRHRHRPAPQEAGWDEILTAAANGGYRLISTGEMADRCRQDPQSLLLVDTRAPAEYLAGHIRGAVNLPLTPTRWGRWRCQQLLATILGPDKERPVVFY